MFAAVEGERGRLALDDRLQVNRPTPDELQVGQRVFRLVLAQVHSVMFVPQQQLAAVLVVAVHDVDPRLAEVGQTEQQPLLDLVELPRLDDVLPRLVLEGEAEHLVLAAELRRQEGIDKGYIVVDAAHLEDFLPPQP